MANLIDGEVKSLLDSLDDIQDFLNYKNWSDFIHRTIKLDSEISDENGSMNIVDAIIEYNRMDKGIPVEERHPIWIFTNSYGGDMIIANAIVDAIETSTTPVYTVNIGESCSAAAFIFIAGHKRFGTKRSALLFHEGSAAFSGTAEQVQNQSDDYKYLISQLYEHMEKYTKFPKNEIKKMMKKEWTVRGDALVENGCVDEVITSLDSII